jgi:GDSL-like Lipase/Acylhydrolase family
MYIRNVFFPEVVMLPARASIVLMLCAGLTCSSGSSGTTGPGGSGGGQGGVGGGDQGDGGSGGSPSGGTGGGSSGSGGGPVGGGPGSAGGSRGGSGGSRGGSTGSGGVSGRSGLDAGAADTRASDASTGGGAGGAAMDGAAPPFYPCPTSGDCKILPLGDSITYGAGADPGDGGGYRDELFTRAVNGGKHITFVGSLKSGPTMLDGQTFPQSNEGHIGWTISQVNSIATTTQTVSVSGTSYPGALRDIPQIVLLFAGTNDEGYATSEAGASDRLGTLIDKIVAAVPDALLVVSSIYPFPGCKSTNYTPTQCAANVAVYDAAIPGLIQQRAAKGAHVLFVDMSNMPSDGLSSDGVHPNITTGYPWMGDNWYAVIEPYLR